MLAPTRLPRALPLLRRSLSTSSYLQNTVSPNAATQSNPSRNPPAATSTSAAQPFSTPLTPSPEAAAATGQPTPHTPLQPVSSVPAGTVLRGLNYHKNKTDPVAKPDEEYPAWLWTLLTPSSGSAAENKELDPRLFAKSANIRRKARKRARADEAGKSDIEANVMAVDERSVDLPLGEEEALKAREELRHTMRRKRRSSIKEANYLKAMG